MIDKQEAMLEAYRRGLLSPEQKGAYDEAVRRGLATDPAQGHRAWYQRLTDDAVDAFKRSGLGTLARNDPFAAYKDPNVSLLDAVLGTHNAIEKGGPVDRALDLVGIKHQAVDSLKTPGDVAEQARRARFAQLSSADPWNSPDKSTTEKVVAGGSALAGTLAGSALSPDSWVAPGRTAVTRIAGQAGANAGIDALLQGNDISTGLRDKFSVGEAAVSGIFGATLGGLREGAGATVRGAAARGVPLPDWLVNAFTDPPPKARQPPPGPQPQQPGGGARSGRFRTEEEIHAEFDARRQQQAGPKPERPQAAQGRGEPRAEDRATSTAAPVDADSRFRTTSDGHVKSDGGAPLAFGTQKEAGRWMLDVGQKTPTDQMFEIANHPTESGKFTVRERGRSEHVATEDPALRQAQAEPNSANAPPAVAGKPAGANEGSAPPSEPPGAAGPTEAPPEPGLWSHDFVQPAEKTGIFRSLKKSITEWTLPHDAAVALHNLYTMGVSRRHPLEQAVETLRSGIEAQTGKPKDIRPSQDPRALASVGHDVANIGWADAVLGVHGYHSMTPESPALHDILVAMTARDVRGGLDPDGALKAFNDYLVDWRGLEEWDRYERGDLEREPLPAGSRGDRASLEQHGALTEKEYPHFVELARQTNAVGKALWKKQLEGGLITQEAFDIANANRSFYVPFNRVMDEGVSVGSSPSNKASLGKAFKGSQRNVTGPFERLVQQVMSVNQRIRQNDINVSLVKMAEELDTLLGGERGANGILTPVKAANRPVEVSAEEMVRAGFDDADEGMTVWRPGDIPENGKPIIYAWRDGKREAWEITDHDFAKGIYEALTGMEKPQHDLWVRMLGIPATALRFAVTKFPAFAISNLVRDQQATFINNPTSFIPFFDALKGIGYQLPRSEVGGRYLSSGGIAPGQIAQGLERYIAHNDVMFLRNLGMRARYAPLQADGKVTLGNIFNLPEIAETATRLGLYQRAFQRAKAEGSTDIDASIGAQATARDTMDFGRGGSRMVTAAKIVPFLNAGMQGLDKGVRTTFGDPAAIFIRGGKRGAATANTTMDKAAQFLLQGAADTLKPLFMDAGKAKMRASDVKAMRRAYGAWATIAVLTTMQLTLNALYQDDPEYQKIPDYIKNSNFLVRVGGQWVAIPKPFEFAVPITIASRIQEAMEFDDPDFQRKLLQGVGQNLALPTDNPLMRTVLELSTNKNFLTGGQIVPDSKLAMMPEDQYSPHTSKLARDIGSAVHQSPSQIEFATNGFTGGWGQMAFRYSNLTDPNRPAGDLSDFAGLRRFFPDPNRGSQTVTDFYDRVGSRTSDLQRTLNSVVEDMKSGRQQRAMQRIHDVDGVGQEWLLSQLAGKDIQNGEAQSSNSATSKLHPLARVKAVTTNVGRMLNELYGDRTKDQGKSTAPEDRVWQPSTMSPQEREQALTVLEQYQSAEAMNGMILSHQPGYANRKLLDLSHYRGQMDAIDPKIGEELDRRLRDGRDKAYPYETVKRLWPQASARLKRDGVNADLSDLAAEASGDIQR